jgi:ADP-glucose pyrophosphorylase
MTINNITLLQDIIPNEMFISNNSNVRILNFYDKLEIKQFLNSLEIYQAYVLTFEFVISVMIYDEDGPSITLGKPIIITKNSNPEIISNYFKERINISIDTFYLDDSILDSNNNPDGQLVLMNYCKINLF